MRRYSRMITIALTLSILSMLFDGWMARALIAASVFAAVVAVACRPVGEAAARQMREGA